MVLIKLEKCWHLSGHSSIFKVHEDQTGSYSMHFFFINIIWIELLLLALVKSLGFMLTQPRRQKLPLFFFKMWEYKQAKTRLRMCICMSAMKNWKIISILSLTYLTRELVKPVCCGHFDAFCPVIWLNRVFFFFLHSWQLKPHNNSEYFLFHLLMTEDNEIRVDISLT